ncbi:MAG TPA: ORF6N domain-containing protein [Puia sp.]|nr:ORF6N domain-containing protein [Puia sp.]
MSTRNPLKKLTEIQIVEKIYLFRGIKVMIDFDLAEMYGVSTSRLNEAVKRNIKRFPKDFMFQLSKDEFNFLISQIAISKKKGRGGTRKMPFAFTEQGVAMLSSVLHSEIAIQVNIQIIRVYTKMRQLLIDNKELRYKIEAVERNLAKKDEEIQAIFKLLKQLLIQKEKPRKPIGFKIPPKK